MRREWGIKWRFTVGQRVQHNVIIFLRHGPTNIHAYVHSRFPSLTLDLILVLPHSSWSMFLKFCIMWTTYVHMNVVCSSDTDPPKILLLLLLFSHLKYNNARTMYNLRTDGRNYQETELHGCYFVTWTWQPYATPIPSPISISIFDVTLFYFVSLSLSVFPKSLLQMYVQPTTSVLHGHIQHIYVIIIFSSSHISNLKPKKQVFHLWSMYYKELE